MPLWFLPHQTGMTGSLSTRARSFSVGMAREEAEPRENILWVISSACTMRGYWSSNVVSRALFGPMLSKMIFAS